MANILFIVITAVVFIIAVQAVKKFAPAFFEKVSKFVPLAMFVIAFGASIVFNLITVKQPEFGYAALTGYFIASTGVYTYEGVYKLFKKIVAFFKQTKDDVKEAVKKGE